MPKHVDDIFQSALDNHHEVADASVWERLSQTLSSKEGKVVLPWFYDPRKALFVALFISMLSFGGGYIYALLNDGEAVLANNQLSKAQITATLPAGNKIADPVPSDLNAFENQESNDNTVATSDQDNIDGFLAENAANKRSYFGPVANDLALAEDSDDKDLNSVADNASERSTTIIEDVFAIAQAVNASATSVSELADDLSKEDEDVVLDHTASSLLEQSETQSLKSHLVSITTPISYGKLVSRFVEFSAGKGMLKSSYTMGDDLGTAKYKSDYRQESNLNYELRFGKYFSPNIGVFTGLRVDRFGFSSNLEQMFVDKDKPNSATGGPSGVVVKSSFNYEFTSYEIPVGLRFKGLYHRLGYHADLGMSFSKGTKQSFSKSLNKEEFDFLNQEVSDTKYDEEMGTIAFSRIGLDYYLFANGGLSLDAVLRRRVTATSNTEGAQAKSLGFQVGLFCNF